MPGAPPQRTAAGKDLELRKQEEEARLERLQGEYAEIKKKGQEILLSAEDRTTNRMMVEYEREPFGSFLLALEF